MVMHFGDRDEWTIDELAEATGIAEAALVPKLKFWVQNGIVLQTNRPAGPSTPPTSRTSDGNQVVYVAAKTFVDGAVQVCLCFAFAFGAWFACVPVHWCACVRCVRWLTHRGNANTFNLNDGELLCAVRR